MIVIQIEESTLDEMSQCVEDMLHLGGKVMNKLERMKEDGQSSMGERRYRTGNRGGNNGGNGGMNYRDPYMNYRDGGYNPYEDMGYRGRY